MTIHDDKKKNPVDRFRSILSAGRERKEDSSTTKKIPTPDHLPRPKPATPAPRAASPAPSPEPVSAHPSEGGRRLRAFWTFASIVSLVFNAILVIALIGIVLGVGGLNPSTIGSGLLGGLYSNFERMDQAHIKADIPVQTTIPLNLSIPVQTTTGITLAQDVLIRNAHVRIATSTFNIDSPADVTLPAGTSLNVILNFVVPVRTSVPVALTVPVDIALKDTELHPAIAGLQNTIKPLICMVNPTALSLSGLPICP